MKDLKYLMAYSVPMSVVVSFYFKGVASYTALAYVFLLIPLAESIITVKQKELSATDIKKRALNRVFDWLLYLNVPIVYTILGYGLYDFSTASLSTYEYIGLVFGLGILLATNAVNVAHELASSAHARLHLRTGQRSHFQYPASKST